MIYTELETQVLEVIESGDFYETPAMPFDEIMLYFKGTEPQLKGVLSSLIKKEAVGLGEYPNGVTSFHYRIK